MAYTVVYIYVTGMCNGNGLCNGYVMDLYAIRFM